MARILIVDDEASIRTMIRLTLETTGHAVETAPDGTQGLTLFGDGSGWDLVLLDQRMPDMPGLDVLREMRRRDPVARVVMITAFGTIDLAVEAMKAGATDFLRKPFTAKVLRGAVDAALGRPQGSAGESAGGTRFGFTTLNGFTIESDRRPTLSLDGEIADALRVRSPEGEVTECTVVLPPYVVELVKAHADREEMPHGDLFWQGLCEEALANYVWQNAAAPGGTLRVDEFSAGLQRWTDSVLSAVK